MSAINSLIIHKVPIWISTLFNASVPKPNGKRISKVTANTSVPNQEDFLTQTERKLILLINKKLLNQL
jgi:hypothetical protein